MISQHYTNWPAVHNGRCLWDLLACIPIDLCAVASPGGILGVTGQWLRSNRLLHGLRVVSVHGAMIQKLPRPKKIAVYGLLWLFLAHHTACGW